MNELLDYLLDGWRVQAWRRYMKGNRIQVHILYEINPYVDYTMSIDI